MVGEGVTKVASAPLAVKRRDGPNQALLHEKRQWTPNVVNKRTLTMVRYRRY